MLQVCVTIAETERQNKYTPHTEEADHERKRRRTELKDAAPPHFMTLRTTETAVRLNAIGGTFIVSWSWVGELVF